MSEHAYRADDALAAALREHAAADAAFTAEHIAPFDQDNPGHELLWVRGGLSVDVRAVGFRDGTDDVPDGLSRARTREELRPKRKTKAGRRWQDVLDLMAQRPRVSTVFAAFKVPETASGGLAPTGGLYVAPTQWADTGDTGVLVFSGGDLDGRGMFSSPDGRGPHLTPIPLSEFYAIKERLESEKDSAAERASR